MPYTVFSGEKIYYYGKHVHTQWKVIKTVYSHAKANRLMTQEMKTEFDQWTHKASDLWEHSNGIDALKIEGV